MLCSVGMMNDERVHVQNVVKMENSHFDTIQCTKVQARVCWPIFESKIKKPLKIKISSNFLHTKRSCICIRKYNKNEKFSPSHF